MHAGPALPPCPRAVPRCQMLKLPPAADTSITTKYDSLRPLARRGLVALLRTLPLRRSVNTCPGFKSPHDQSHGPVACRRCRRPCTALSLRSVVHVSHTLSAPRGPVEHLTGPLRRVRPTSSPPTVSHRCTRGSRGCAELVAGVPDAHAAFERALQSTGIGLADVAFFAAMGWSTHAGRSTSVELKEQKWK